MFSPYIIVLYIFFCFASAQLIFLSFSHYSHPDMIFFLPAELNNKIFFTIISNVFHKLDSKRDNSPLYLQSDYQMMMDNRLIRVTQEDASSCV